MDTFFFVISKLVGLGFFFESWVVLLALAGLLFRRPRFIRAALILLLSITVFPLGDLLLKPLERRFPAPELPAQIDGILLLGGSESALLTQAWGQPVLNGAAERYLAAATLALRHPEAKLLFTGGSGRIIHRDAQEASVAETLLLGLGVAPEHLLIDGAARNTAENAKNAKALADPQPGETWVLVTSAAHMPRSVGAFCAQGWVTLPYPTDFRSGPFLPRIGWSLSDNLEDINSGIHEWVGLLAYYLTGRTNQLLPTTC